LQDREPSIRTAQSRRDQAAARRLVRQLPKKPLRERPWNYEMSLGSTWDETIAGKVTSASEARARIIKRFKSLRQVQRILTNLLH
jgi:hypothetical protein